MIISTIYDLLVQRKKSESHFNILFSINLYRDMKNINTICVFIGKPHPLLVSYSVYTNGKKLFSISKNAGEFECLNGIRVLSMMWVICYHIFFNQVYGPNDNFSDIVKVIRDNKKNSKKCRVVCCSFFSTGKKAPLSRTPLFPSIVF